MMSTKDKDPFTVINFTRSSAFAAIAGLLLSLCGFVWIIEFCDPHTSIFKCPGLAFIAAGFLIIWLVDKSVRKDVNKKN